MLCSIATLTLESFAPYSQSRQHDAPKLEGESIGDWDKRTWKDKALLNADGYVVIPAHGFHQCLANAAKYSKRQIPGQGKATWTKKFEAGIMLLGDITTNALLGDNDHVTISANADGVRGSGKRVPRKFPQVPTWEAKFEVMILDPIITQDVFREMVELAGMFIGMGRFRPEKMGTNGRFRIKELQWEDNRKLVA